MAGKRKKDINSREMRKILKQNGWFLDRVSGDHYIYKKQGQPHLITVSYRGFNKMIGQRLISTYDLVS